MAFFCCPFRACAFTRVKVGKMYIFTNQRHLFVIGPHWKFSIVMFLGMIMVVWLFILTFVPQLQDDLFLQALGGLLIACTFFFFIRTVLKDPGIPKEIVEAYIVVPTQESMPLQPGFVARQPKLTYIESPSSSCSAEQNKHKKMETSKHFGTLDLENPGQLEETNLDTEISIKKTPKKCLDDNDDDDDDDYGDYDESTPETTLELTLNWDQNCESNTQSDIEAMPQIEDELNDSTSTSMNGNMNGSSMSNNGSSNYATSNPHLAGQQFFRKYRIHPEVFKKLLKRSKQRRLKYRTRAFETPIKCDYCNVYQDDNTFHCDECDICIRGHDHHCPWTSKCIGKDNILDFYLWVAVSLVTILYYGVSAGVKTE